ncbi:hypothetical protein L226DRAFT_524716 [Lentinus tigrinus ALCF2SS1-7]|uniref:uncharacterized protein n=1 Tax=Lentinus tigrinus ALCF2SS1-7 TaxID=1328758 RepID=UPI001165D57A|nr:hypothetical protein L226DRAFT_524716 [Lentinus tigrinus ALCF2SS1-7]
MAQYTNCGGQNQAHGGHPTLMSDTSAERAGEPVMPRSADGSNLPVAALGCSGVRRAIDAAEINGRLRYGHLGDNGSGKDWLQWMFLQLSRSARSLQQVNICLARVQIKPSDPSNSPAPSRDFTTAVYSVVNEFDRFLSLRDGHIVPEEHRSLVDVAHDIIALLAANSKAIARVVAHVELIVSGMAARELAISDVLCLPRWFFTDDLGVASVALHNTLHTFVSSANASASYLDHSLSAAQDSTKRVLDRLEDLNALGRGQIAPWKCPWPVISSAVDDPTSELPLPCATSFVARHCIIRMQAVHGILSTIREDVADIISDLGSRSIPPPPFDRCPLDVAYVKYHGHAQLLQKRSLALADFRSRVFAQLNAG